MIDREIDSATPKAGLLGLVEGLADALGASAASSGPESHTVISTSASAGAVLISNSRGPWARMARCS
jgi:hypothetical protein